jgi:2-C-methyl-D-erythritol 4-phosphate cytidylyltransferase
MRKFVVITAGGSGARMNSDLPKQFIEIAGKPLLFHTIDAFVDYAPDIELVLVLSDQYVSYWENLCKKYKYSFKHLVTTGGPTRFQSVKSGLNLVPNGALVAIHDSVRPLVSKKTIESVFYFAEKYGNAVPAVEVFDSLRITDHALSKPLLRDKVRIVQTPQCFKSDLIKDAYNQNFHENFTDDATVLESKGHGVRLVEGNRENIKITAPEDFIYAQALLKGTN